MHDSQELSAQCRQLYSTALQHHQSGRLVEAAATYRQLLQIKPDFLEALGNLGTVLHADGQLDAAIECFHRAVDIYPDNDRLRYSLGAAQQAAQRQMEAEASYRDALLINPDLLEARFNLGILLRDSGRLEEAAACFRQIIDSNPGFAEGHQHLGIVHYLLGDYRNALTSLKQALALKPENPEVLNTLGNILMQCGDYDSAVELFREALRLTPEDPKLHFNLGTAMKETVGREAAAATSFEAALQRDPGMIKAFAEIFRIRQTLCAWDSYDPDLERLLRLNQASLAKGGQSPIYPFDALSLPLSAREQRDIAASQAREISSRTKRLQPAPTVTALDRGERLRIGYVSANFNNHAEAHLTASLFGLHDRRRYEVFAYSTGHDDGSSYRQRIRQGCEHFIDVQRESDREIAGRILADGIHILVDLAVYNKHPATGIFALRPAPVQVNYLGFPGTSGADFYDYILTDRIVTPPDQQVWYSETFAYLPGCYQVNDHELVIPEPDPDRTRYGLPPTGFVFCSFNNSYKIEPRIFDVWMRILEQAPGSVLWLLDHGEPTNTNLRREAQRRDVDRDRLVFAPKLAKEAHLARHRHANLFLDTLYYNAHTTASDALRAGVPIVTLAGNTFASRVAASLLEAVDMSDLITTSITEYTNISIRLSTDILYYLAIKNKLSTNLASSRLFDTPWFVQNLEQAYEEMWQSALSGTSP